MCSWWWVEEKKKQKERNFALCQNKGAARFHSSSGKGGKYAKIAKKKRKKKKIAQRTDWVVFLKSCHGAQNSSVDLRMKSWQMGSAEPGITALSDEAAPHCISASQKWQQRWWGCWQDGWQYFIYCIFFFFPPSWARCKSKSVHMIFQRLWGETLETHVVCKIQMHLQPVRCHLK